MKTAIIILNYNDYETTSNMLNKIKDYKSLDLIVVIDNKSKDNSYNKLKHFENDKIKVMETKENKGYATKEHLRVISERGLTPIHRLSFKNVLNLQEKMF